MIYPSPASAPRRATRALSFGAFALTAIACGSRGPLDLGPNGMTSDASVEDASANVDSGGGPGGPGVVTDASATHDGDGDSGGGHDVDAGHEAGLINCGQCVA